MTENRTSKKTRIGSAHFTVRVSKEVHDAILSECSETMRTPSETIRLIISRHVFDEKRLDGTFERISQVHSSVRELGIDLQTVTRLFLVAAKLSSDEEAKLWTRQNLLVGK